MSGSKSRKCQDPHKSFPGCMGRVVNVFDLTADIQETKFVTDNAHKDGSPIHRKDPEVVKNIKDCSDKKSCETPMKMLIAREMSKATTAKRNPSNVVARLMGLDEALPAHPMLCTIHYRDRYDESQSDRRMVHVRKKFMELMVDTASSNKDSFLKFLDEPNSLLSKHLKELHSKSTPPRTTRITVLKPLSATRPTRIVVLKPTIPRHHQHADLESHISAGSVFSNGYVGDGSSFSKSENEYAEEESANPSDSEIVTPALHHSWDYVKRYTSSYSPEPSVITEAKKRLSERCALVASDRYNRKQTEVRSSTLGEMLALSAIKQEEMEEESGVLTNRVSTCKTKDGERGDGYICNLSKSEVSEPQVEEVPKHKNEKSSFKGKISRLFFSRNKNIEPICERTEDLLKLSPNSHSEDCHIGRSGEESTKTSNLRKDGLKSVMPKISYGHEDSPDTSRKTSQNQDRPSPTSVLDGPFGYDSDTSYRCETSGAVVHPLTAVIEEVARSLSWEDADIDGASAKANEEDNQRRSFVRSLLSASGFDNVKLDAVFAGFYSVDSPLGPSLRDTLGRRSDSRLLFDCVNSALLEMDRTTYLRACPGTGGCRHTQKKVLDGVMDWFSGTEKLESDGADDNALAVERWVARDICGSGWADSTRTEIDTVDKEMSGEILGDLVAEAIAELNVIL